MPKQFECREAARKMIAAAAGKQLREKGFDGIGVDGLMRESGLTSGAFYTQFESKKDLLLEVLNQGLTELKERVSQWQQSYGEDWLAKGLDEYFSQDHRQCSASGCVLPSLSIEVARDAGGCAAKRQFEEKLRQIVDLTTGDNPQDRAAARQQMWTALALMTGGMILARAMAQDETANEILTACQKTARNL